MDRRVRGIGVRLVNDPADRWPAVGALAQRLGIDDRLVPVMSLDNVDHLSGRHTLIEPALDSRQGNLVDVDIFACVAAAGGSLFQTVGQKEGHDLVRHAG